VRGLRGAAAGDGDAWPEPLAIHSAKDGRRPPAFELHAPGGGFMFFQGPFRPEKLPPREKMVGLGQTLARMGEAERYGWVELSYRHEGAPWVQRHYLILLRPGHTLVLSVQAPAAAAGATMALADRVAGSVLPGLPREAARA
jgi:hypothetical protein